MALKIGVLTERMILGFGVDLVVDQTATYLVKNGYDVVVYTTRMSDTYGETAYKTVDLSKVIPDVKNIFSVAYMQKAVPYLGAQGVDVWIVHTPPFYYWLSHFQSPAIAVEHGTPPGYFFPKSVGKRLDVYTNERFRKIYPSMRSGDGLVAISNYIKTYFPKNLQSMVDVIYNGTDHYPRASMEAVAVFRSDLGISPDEQVILWVGRIQFENDPQPYKGLKEFVEMASIILRKHPAARVVAVGRGEPEDKERLRKSGIIPLFNLGREKMPIAFASADVFISTSKWEGFNLPLTEAQFQGTPVVAYRVCSHPEVVADGYSGILADTREEFLSAIFNLLDDKEYRNKLATGARKYSSRFTWENNVQSMMRLLEACHKQGGDRRGSDTVTPVKKNLKYYKNMAEDIVRLEGWGALLRETKGWLRRRIGRKEK